MTRDKENKLFKETVVKLYNEAENVLGEDFHFDSYEDFLNCCPEINGKRYAPYASFYIDKEKQNEILADIEKQFRKHWMYTRKINYENGKDKHFEAYKKDMDEYERNKKTLTPYQRKKKMKELAEKHQLQYRNRRVEGLCFEILNISPSCSKEAIDRLKEEMNKEHPNERYNLDIQIIREFSKNYKSNHLNKNVGT